MLKGLDSFAFGECKLSGRHIFCRSINLTMRISMNILITRHNARKHLATGFHRLARSKSEHELMDETARSRLHFVSRSLGPAGIIRRLAASSSSFSSYNFSTSDYRFPRYAEHLILLRQRQNMLYERQIGTAVPHLKPESR